ncbi:O-antigen ligase [Marinobacter sp. es.042]|uniref:O-antigen ligase family protein n=1 Tax=Marinobacter sp. es.042 TaxID=1761794 RepID=UPI000B506908|nr:O-antigen ligase family protein [Marinobacter sp. es.042]SNB54870.1 O-antigen ligase [Marinobacter sp. es.042]
MTKTQTFFVSLLTLTVLLSVLFADLLPKPVGSYAFQRFLQVGILTITCTAVGAFYISRYGIETLNKLWPALIVASGFLLLTFPFRESLYAWVEPGLYAVFFFGFVAMGNLAGSDRTKHQLAVILVYCAAVAVALYGATTIMVYLFALSDEVSQLSAFIPWGFVNIRYWSHIATWLMPLLPLAVLIGPLQNQRLWRFFCALGAAIWWWVIFLSTSRGTMLGLIFGLFIVLVFVGRPALPWVKVFLRYLGYGLFAWLVLSVLIPSILIDELTVRALHAGSAGRMPLFIEAWRMSFENFPLGMGPLSWLTHETLTDEYLKSSKFGHPHNMYLMWAAEYGWLVICALLALVVQAIRLFWERRRELRNETQGASVLILAAFTASVSAALLHAGVSSVFIAPGSMLIGFLVLCVFWALISPSWVVSSQGSGGNKALYTVAFIAIGFVACLWLREVVIYYDAMLEDRNYRFETAPYGTPPRFWHYGMFPRPPSQMIQGSSGSSPD